MCETDHPLHGRTPRYEVLDRQRARCFRPGAAACRIVRLHLDRLGDGGLQAFGRDRLDHEVEGTGAHGGDDGIDPGLRRLHDDGGADATLPHGPEHRQPIRFRHDEVEHDDREILRCAGETLQRRLAAVRADDLAPRPRNRCFEQPALDGIIIDDQDTTRHFTFAQVIYWLKLLSGS